jgi:hypothetical protein
MSKLAHIRQQRTLVVPCRELPRSIETRNKLLDCGASRWNKSKKKTVLFAFNGERPRNKTLSVTIA